MLQQHTLRPHPGSFTHKPKRRGRGGASGRGSYSGRGVKGQNSRTGGGVRPGFEGGQTPLSRRLPKARGFTNPTKVYFQVVNLGDLTMYDDGGHVDVASLFTHKLISKKNTPVKVLGNGEFTKKLNFKVEAVSHAAREKIEKANGTIELVGKKAVIDARKKTGNEE